MDTKLTNNYLNDLKKRILKLGNNEYLEIYKIIVDNNINHTKNKNGVFINLLNVDSNTIDKIEKLLKYYNELDSKDI